MFDIARVSGAPSTGADDLRIQVRGGILKGTYDPNGARAWRGIPFAAAPIGPLRGRAAHPHQGWNGEWDARQFRSEAVQLSIQPLPLKLAGSEDCLFLNVWAPPVNTRQKRPVLFWIHGGAFVRGSSSNPVYDGADYAMRGDLIYVSANYRLGGFGYLSTDRDPGSANLGLLDQIAALAWVRDNIEAFGGDPDRVTVMGQSAGGMSIGCLLGAPGARGLFKQAIIQSGGARPIFLGPEPEQVFDEVCHIAKTRDPLSLSTAELFSVFAELANRSDSALLGGEPFHPAVDGIVLPKHPLEALSPVSAMIGHCAYEARPFTRLVTAKRFTSGLPRRVRTLVGESTWSQIGKAYRNRGQEWQSDLFTDIFIAIPSLRLADSLTAAGASVWSYRFEYDGASSLGAYHGSDIPFTFGRPGQWAPSVIWDAPAQALSRLMRASFIT